MGWLLIKKDPAVIEAGKQLNYDDLLADPLVRFQKKYDPWFALFCCFVLPALVPMLWGENFWNGYWTAGALRYVFVLHATWCVNSVAHLWGDRPYDKESLPAENLFVSIIAVGEGWHNWHHKFPYDYATSEKGCLEQYNPTKFIIDCMYHLGMAHDRKRAKGAWNKMKANQEHAAMKEFDKDAHAKSM